MGIFTLLPNGIQTYHAKYVVLFRQKVGRKAFPDELGGVPDAKIIFHFLDSFIWSHIPHLTVILFLAKSCSLAIRSEVTGAENNRFRSMCSSEEYVQNGKFWHILPTQDSLS